MNVLKSRWVWTILAIVLAAGGIGTYLIKHRCAEWTVMVYMNGTGDLEETSLCNFYDFARVEHDKTVNIVVEFARSGKNQTTIVCDSLGGKRITPLRWEGVGRFFVNQNDEPTPSVAQGGIQSSDISNSGELGSFLSWAKSNYKARNYMLLFVNHGDGTALGKHPPDESFFLNFSYFIRNQKHRYKRRSKLQDTTKKIDHAHNPQLYVSDIAPVLSNIFHGDNRLAIVGLDACLMGMIENAYALRNVAHLMVANESVSPKQGWGHSRWLEALAKKPTMEKTELTRLIVQAYNDTYRSAPNGFTLTTISAVNLDNLNGLVDALNNFVNLSADNMAAVRSRFVTARNRQYPYYDGIYPLDLGGFLDLVLNPGNISNVTELPDAVELQRARLYGAIQSVLVQGYASEQSKVYFGSTGLAIYFPDSQTHYLNTICDAGYGPGPHLGEFARNEHWQHFLNSLWDTKQRSDVCPTTAHDNH